MFGIGKSKDVRLEFYESSKISFLFSFKSRSLKIKQVDEIFNDLNRLLSINIRTCLTHGNLSDEPDGIVDSQSQFVIPQSRDQIFIGNPYHNCCPPNDVRIELGVEGAEKLLASDIIQEVTKWDNFRSLYVINCGYASIQVTTQEEFYRRNNIPTKGIIFKKEKFGNIREIDTIKNPAPAYVIKDSWLTIGWKMWFNNDFFNQVIGKKISEFTGGLETRDDGNITFIQLYERQNEPHFSESLKKQDAFKKWINFENIIQSDRKN